MAILAILLTVLLGALFERWTRDGVVGAAPALGVMELVTCEVMGLKPTEDPLKKHVPTNTVCAVVCSYLPPQRHPFPVRLS